MSPATPASQYVRETLDELSRVVPREFFNVTYPGIAFGRHLRARLAAREDQGQLRRTMLKLTGRGSLPPLDKRQPRDASLVLDWPPSPNRCKLQAIFPTSNGLREGVRIRIDGDFARSILYVDYSSYWSTWRLDGIERSWSPLPDELRDVHSSDAAWLAGLIAKMLSNELGVLTWTVLSYSRADQLAPCPSSRIVNLRDEHLLRRVCEEWEDQGLEVCEAILRSWSGDFDLAVIEPCYEEVRKSRRSS